MTNEPWTALWIFEQLKTDKLSPKGKKGDENELKNSILVIRCEPF